MDKKQIIKEFYEYIVSNNRIHEIDKYVSRECTARDGESTIPVGLEGMKQRMINVRKTYPDLKIRITGKHIDEDFVISEIRVLSLSRKG